MYDYKVLQKGFRNREIQILHFMKCLGIFTGQFHLLCYHKEVKKCMETSVDDQKLTMETCTGFIVWNWKRKSLSGVIRN